MAARHQEDGRVRHPGVLSVSEVSRDPVRYHDGLITVRGYLIDSGDYLELRQDGRSACYSDDPAERFLVVQGLDQADLKHLRGTSGDIDRRVTIRGVFSAAGYALPAEVNGVSTWGWEAPMGPLRSAHIVNAGDETCEGQPVRPR
jgi:hypothetical protein